MERTNSGIYHEMKQRMAVETEPFTLFDIALNQTIARDVRQVAANRLNELHSSIVFGYLDSIEDPELLASIGRSGMFPTTITFTAKSRAKAMKEPKDSVTMRILAAMQEQNRLLKQLASASGNAGTDLLLMLLAVVAIGAAVFTLGALPALIAFTHLATLINF